MDVDILTREDVLRESVEAFELHHTEEHSELFAVVSGDAKIATNDAIGFRDIDGRYRIFEITRYAIREPEGTIEINAVDKAVTELMDEPLTEYRARNTSIAAFMQRILQNTRFTIGRVAVQSSGTTTAYYESVYSAMTKAQEAFDVRLVPYYEVSGGIVTGRKIDILATDADYKGRIFELDDDLNGITITYDDSNIKTALFGRGQGVEIEGEDSSDPTYGRRITFADVVWSKANGDPVDKPAGQEWVGDPDALATYGRSGRHRFGYAVFDSETDPEALLAETWEQLQEIKEPYVSIECTVQDTERLMGRKHEAVRLYDQVLVRMVKGSDSDKKITDIHAQVSGIVRDYIQPERTKLTIGNATIKAGDFVAKLSNTVDNFSSRSAVWDRAKAFDLQGAMDVMNNQILSTVGGWYTDPDTGAIMLVSSDGTKAMRLTGAGWQIAASKTGNQWDWRTAATGSGLVADMITSGVINAGLVTIGGTGTTLDGTSLTIVHSNLGEDVKTVINENGMLFMSGSTIVGGFIRVNNSVTSAVQALYNPTVSTLNVQIGSGLYGSEDGLTFKLGTVGCFDLNAIRNGFRLQTADGDVTLYAAGGALAVNGNAVTIGSATGQLALTAKTNGSFMAGQEMIVSGGGLTAIGSTKSATTVVGTSAKQQNSGNTAAIICNADGSITLRWKSRYVQREMTLEDLYNLIPKG